MTAGVSFKEKRNHPRVPIEMPVRYRIIENSAEIGSLSDIRKKEIDSQTVDVSLGGMYVAGEQRMNVGSIISVQFSIPETKKNLSAFAEVVWVNDRGGGVHFLALKEEDMNSLVKVISKASGAR